MPVYTWSFLCIREVFTADSAAICVPNEISNENDATTFCFDNRFDVYLGCQHSSRSIRNGVVKYC